MKALIFSILSIVAATSAQACQISEAQVIGTVIQSSLSGSVCETVVDLDLVNQHQICPLRLRVGQRVSIEVQKRGDRCPLSGEAISGVIQSIGGKLRLDE